MTALRRGGKDNPVATTLKELFRTFDKDGSGELQLSELYAELSSVPGVTLTSLQKLRLKNQFAHMDMNGDGGVTYPEFEKAALAALSSDFSSLQEQRECEAFGYDFFTLMALSRRSELAKTQKHNVFAEFDKMKEMSRMAFLTLDMMEQERRKHRETASILRTTTVDYGQTSSALATERAAVLARARYTKTLHPESSHNHQRNHGPDTALHDLQQTVAESARCQRRKFKRRLVRDLQPLPHTVPTPGSASCSTSSYRSTSSCFDGPLSPLPTCRQQQHPHQVTSPGARRQQSGVVLSPLRQRSSPRPSPPAAPDSPVSSIASIGSSSLESAATRPSYLPSTHGYHSLASSHAANSSTTSAAADVSIAPLKTSKLLLPVLLPQSSTASNFSKIRERRIQKLKAAGANYMMQHTL